MKVLLFKKTTDNDLFKGLKVAYNKAGEYTAGVITAITEQDGKKLYNVAGALYLADELKLIEQPEINDFEKLKQAVIKDGLFGERSGKYYGCLCNKNFSIHNF